jgi:hypothetical protein
MIRQFRQRWKCGKGSSLFAKFVHTEPSDDSTAVAPALHRNGCALHGKNRCDLVTNGWKVPWRQRTCPPEITSFPACASGRPSLDHPTKLFFDQSITTAEAKVPGAAPAVKSARDEQTRVNTCGFLRLPTAAFRPNDDRG